MRTNVSGRLLVTSAIHCCCLVPHFGKAGEFEQTECMFVEISSRRAWNRRVKEKKRSDERITLMSNANFCGDANHPTSFG